MQDINTPGLCAARAADPVWQAEQRAKNEAATARFIERRAAAGMPIEQKKSGERF